MVLYDGETLWIPPAWIKYKYCQLCGTELTRTESFAEHKFNRITGNPYTWTVLKCPNYNPKDTGLTRHDWFYDYTAYGE